TDSEESDSNEFMSEGGKKRKRPLRDEDEKNVQTENNGKNTPLNLDRQCGVLIPPTNEPCTRAITCKIHSVGAKRAVAGRSQSFNDLIAVYQKKGIGRPQDLKIVLEESREQENSQQETDIDYDEETESVYIAVKEHKPQPLGERQVFYVQRKRKYFKIRDILLEAITPKSSQCQIPHIDI
ncbi:SCA7-domain-containing protein, partial [Rhizopus microsporus var. microsporus]